MSSQRPRKGRPTLRTARLILEPMAWDHLEDLVGLDGDPEVMRFIGPPLARDEVVERMPGRLSPSDDALGLGFWCGFEQQTFLGWWCLSLEGPGLAELGYRLHRHSWGRGLASEGARALIDHGFGVVGLKRIMAETMAVNAGSRGVLAKVGLRHTGTEVRTWAEPLPGAGQGEVTYEITRAEWRRLPAGRPPQPTWAGPPRESS